MVTCRLQLFAESEHLQPYLKTSQILSGQASALPGDVPDDITEVQLTQDGNTRPGVGFKSATVPLRWLELLSNAWPDIEFRLVWYDEIMAGIGWVQAGVTKHQTATEPDKREALLREYGAWNDSLATRTPTPPPHRPGGPYENTEASGEDTAVEDNTSAANEWADGRSRGER